MSNTILTLSYLNTYFILFKLRNILKDSQECESDVSKTNIDDNLFQLMDSSSNLFFHKNIN